MIHHVIRIHTEQCRIGSCSPVDLVPNTVCIQYSQTSLNRHPLILQPRFPAGFLTKQIFTNFYYINLAFTIWLWQGFSKSEWSKYVPVYYVDLLYPPAYARTIHVSMVCIALLHVMHDTCIYGLHCTHACHA